MNIYHPYNVLVDDKDCFHLKESESNERPRFVRSTVMPIILIMLVWFILQQFGSMLPMGWNYGIVAVALLVGALLAFRQYVTEIKITAGKGIFLVITSALGKKKITIPLANIKAVSLSIKTNKTKQALFKLSLRKPDVSYTVLDIPFSSDDEHRIKLIKEKLEEILLLKIDAI